MNRKLYRAKFALAFGILYTILFHLFFKREISYLLFIEGCAVGILWVYGVRLKPPQKK
jgi:hypothetical protein